MTPEALSALHTRVFTVPRPFTPDEFRALLSMQGALLCKEDGGFALGRSIHGEAELLTLAVAPELRRSGIGSRLLHRFEVAAAANGAKSVLLEVSQDNEAARALYRRAGYLAAGRRPGYYRMPDRAAVDALILHKALP
ncbi:MAG: GNAT family N-acetyltransferase [Pseudomonadota bacterium]